MYKVSNNYRKIIYSGESDNMPLLTINGTEIPYDRISKIEIDDPIIDTTNQVFYIGTFISKKITITFRNTNGIPLNGNVHLEIGSKVSLNEGEELPKHYENGYEYVPIGEFVIDTPSEDFYAKSQLVCMDRAVLFKPNVDYSGALVDGQITVENLLKWLCQHFGVELGGYPDTPNNTKTISSYDSTISGKRYISWIAEIMGSNAKMGRDGKLYIVPLKSDPVTEIDALSGKSWETIEKYHISKVRFDNGVLVKELGGSEEVKEVSGSNELTLPNAISGQIQEYKIDGKNEEALITGKNKYDATRTPQLWDGLTYEATTSEVKVNGTALYDGDWYYGFNQMDLPNGTYTLCIELVSGEFYNNKSLTQSPIVTCQIGNYNFSATYKIHINSSLSATKGYFTFQLPQSSSNSFKIGFAQINKDTIANNAVFKYQVIEGEQPDYDFEPYTGGVPIVVEKPIDSVSIQVNEEEARVLDLQGNTLGDGDILTISNGTAKINNEIELGTFDIQLADGNNIIKAITPFDTTTSVKYLAEGEIYNTLILRNENLFIQETDFESRVQNIYDLVKNFEIWSLKCENQGDPSLDSYDIVTYDVNGIKYNTFYSNTITYEMTLMVKVNVSIPTKQVQQTTNVVEADPMTEIKKVTVEVNQLDGTIKQVATETETMIRENYSEISDKFNGYVPQSEFVTYTQQMTETLENNKKIFATVQQLTDGSVTMVKTGTTTIDIDGILLEGTQYPSKGRYTPANMQIIDTRNSNNNNELFFAGYDTNTNMVDVRTEHINIKTYMNICDSSIKRAKVYIFNGQSSASSAKNVNGFFFKK